MSTSVIRIGTRGSTLARWQAHYVAQLLENAGYRTEEVIIKTQGDKVLNTSIAKIGSKGVFTEELENQLKEGFIDIAVHSAKDLQSSLDPSLELIGFSEREIVNDVLLACHSSISLTHNKNNIVIGTSSQRRIALIRHFFPHATLVDMRGNLQTRIKKMQDGHCDGIILAYAGVKRMEYEGMIREKLPINKFPTPAGQGSIAIEASKNLEKQKYDAVKTFVNNKKAETCLLTERAFLEKLQGGCSIPSFAHAYIEDRFLHFTAGIISLDGKEKVAFKDKTTQFDQNLNLGYQLAQKVLDNGGREILNKIKRQLNL